MDLRGQEDFQDNMKSGFLQSGIFCVISSLVTFYSRMVVVYKLLARELFIGSESGSTP